jgi:hypothetical protein
MASQGDPKFTLQGTWLLHPMSCKPPTSSALRHLVRFGCRNPEWTGSPKPADRPGVCLKARSRHSPVHDTVETDIDMRGVVSSVASFNIPVRSFVARRGCPPGCHDSPGLDPLSSKNSRSPTLIRFVSQQIKRQLIGRPPAATLTISSRLSRCQFLGFQHSTYVVAVASTGSRISKLTTSVRPACRCFSSMKCRSWATR